MRARPAKPRLRASFPVIVAVVVAVAGLAGAGCIDAFAPEVGAPVAIRCDDADGDPAAGISYATDVAPLFAEYCQGCHTPGGRSPVGVEIGGLDLSTYAKLRAGGATSGSRIVVPGQPCASALVQKVRPLPPFGARMPLSGPPFLDDHEIQLLHDWIAEGARDN